MNTCGNIGGAIAAAVSAYLATVYGWNAPFLVVAALSVLAGSLFLKIDAGRKIFAAGPDGPTLVPGRQDQGSAS